MRFLTVIAVMLHIQLVMDDDHLSSSVYACDYVTVI